MFASDNNKETRAVLAVSVNNIVILTQAVIYSALLQHVQTKHILQMVAQECKMKSSRHKKEDKVLLQKKP